MCVCVCVCVDTEVMSTDSKLDECIRLSWLCSEAVSGGYSHVNSNFVGYFIIRM